MSKGLCVFDLDNTLGDFRAIDFFGLIYEPKVNVGWMRKNSEKERFFDIIRNYNSEETSFLEVLRYKFEKELHDKNLDKLIFRPDLKTILQPLVDEYKKNNILGFVIYSNNGNLYPLEYAARYISNMFKTPQLFLNLLHRHHYLRNMYDGPSNGARLKKVVTIKQLYPEVDDKHILFMDDVIHNDFYTNLDISYVYVPSYETSVVKDDLEEIFSVFEKIFYSFDKDIQEKFFNLYHIKNYLGINSMEELKKNYLIYSNEAIKPKPFNENLEMIREKIQSYLMKFPKEGGRKRTRKQRPRNRTKRVKHGHKHF